MTAAAEQLAQTASRITAAQTALAETRTAQDSEARALAEQMCIRDRPCSLERILLRISSFHHIPFSRLSLYSLPQKYSFADKKERAAVRS